MSNPLRNRASHNVSRREFVKTTAGVLAGSLGACSLPAATWLQADGKERIRVGLVGCGGRGTGAAVQALTADPAAVLTAVGDVFEDRISSSLEALAKEPIASKVQVEPERRFVGFDAYRKVIESGVDVVLLAEPPHFRPAHLKAAIEAGKHVFCEKPMAVDVPGIRSVLASAEEARKKRLSLVSGFCWRYSDPERATFRKIHDGAIGKVQAVHTTYHAGLLSHRPRQPGWSDMEWQLRNWYYFTWLSGDHIVEQAVHSVDKIAWAMNGEIPVKATALGGRQVRTDPAFGNVYDHFAVVYEYASGARCFHTCRQMEGCSYDNTDYVLGTEGTCFVNGWGPTHVIEGKRPWRYEGPKRNMYQVEHDDLFAAIRSGEPINDGVWMCNSNLMAILGRMAAYTGQTVTWDQLLASDEDLSPPRYEWGDLPVRAVAMPGKPRLATPSVAPPKV
jgi:myo-inositol 2-dehydrogenase / D-chiro-inositol 1-dehydrogenase